MWVGRARDPLLRIAVFCCFALAIVPRAAVYTHQHAHDPSGHVHAWDGARLDAVRELIDEARGGHDHAHAHAHGAHDHASDAHLEHEPGHRHERPAPAAHARADRRDAGGGPAYASAASAGTLHGHSQPPFQTAAEPAVVRLVVDRLLTPVAAPASLRPLARAHACVRARAPPSVVQA